MLVKRPLVDFKFGETLSEARTPIATLARHSSPPLLIATSSSPLILYVPHLLTSLYPYFSPPTSPLAPSLPLCSQADLISAALYPDVFNEWRDYELVYGEVAKLPTPIFLNPMQATRPHPPSPAL